MSSTGETIKIKDLIKSQRKASITLLANINTVLQFLKSLYT